MLLIPIIARSQVTIVGQIFAEVVGSVSAKSKALTNINIQPNTNKLNEDIDLGSISVDSVTSGCYDIVISSSDLLDSKGNKINLKLKPEVTKTKVNIKGKVNSKEKSSDELEDKLYRGSYSMIIAYN